MRRGACNPCFPIELHKRIAMTKTFGRWVLGLALAAGTAGVTVPMLVHADSPAPQQLATVDQLKAEAFKALKLGQFDRTSELLTRASAGANDPQRLRTPRPARMEEQPQTPHPPHPSPSHVQPRGVPQDPGAGVQRS